MAGNELLAEQPAPADGVAVVATQVMAPVQMALLVQVGVDQRQPPGVLMTIAVVAATMVSAMMAAVVAAVITAVMPVASVVAVVATVLVTAPVMLRILVLCDGADLAIIVLGHGRAGEHQAGAEHQSGHYIFVHAASRVVMEPVASSRSRESVLNFC